MRTNVMVIAVLQILFCMWTADAGSATTVTNTNDSGPGSLRQAILDANASPGLDVIQFSIPGAGPHTILPLSPLPTITDPVDINGYTQPGAAEATETETAVLKIELDGTHAGTLANALKIEAPGTNARGLVVNRFSGEGSIQISGAAATGNKIAGNFLGTDVTGTLDLGNASHGVMILEASHNTIGGPLPGDRNVISGNDGCGVGITGYGATENVVQGNLIGTDVTGTSALGNASTGIDLADGPTGNVIGGNAIADNGAAGVVLDGPGTTENIVVGNLIGTALDGASALPNSVAGVWIVNGASSNTIGGITPEARNIISGNGGTGITSRLKIQTSFRAATGFKGTSSVRM